jgi:N-formylglutamate amidohydrolase
MVLGDRFGSSCDGDLTDMVESVLRDMGYYVVRNNPYAGGYTTAHYGKPRQGVHALQIEINRALYMDEDTINRLPGIAPLTGNMGRLAEALAGADFRHLDQRGRPRSSGQTR